MELNEKDSLNLKSISYNLKRLADLKESEVILKRIEIMLHENFRSPLLSSTSMAEKASKEFYEDFKDGI